MEKWQKTSGDAEQKKKGKRGRKERDAEQKEGGGCRKEGRNGIQNRRIFLHNSRERPTAVH